MIGDRKGSVTIFVMMFLVTLISMVMVFVQVSKSQASLSVSRELASLWAGNLLAEYDLNLKNRYDIYGFYSLGLDSQEKVTRYANQSFRGKRYISYDGCDVDTYDYCLSDTDEFRKQVVEVGKLTALKKIVRKDLEVGNIKSLPSAGAGSITSELPSSGSPSSFNIPGAVSKLKSMDSFADVIKEGTDEFFEAAYLFQYMHFRGDGRRPENTYLKQEVEYVICGNLTDAENESGIKLRIIAIREGLNMVYMLKDPAMNAATMAAAEVITPGPGAILTQKAIQAAWALAESNNDYKALINGKKIPFLKTPETWATDLKAIVGAHPKKTEDPKFKDEVPYIDTGVSVGQDYEDYLRAMIALTDEDVKLLRMMDIIQMNMRKNYYGGFKIKNYYTGVKLRVKVNGKTVTAEKRYEANQE